MDTVEFAQRLKAQLKDVPAIEINDINPAYMSMTDFKGCIEVLNAVIEEAYYDGYSDKVEFHAKKLIKVTELLIQFNNTFGL